MGRFAYDAMCGQGTYYTMDGRIIMGIWEDNVLKEIIFQI